MRENIWKLISSKNVDDIKIGIELATDEEIRSKLIGFMSSSTHADNPCTMLYFRLKGVDKLILILNDNGKVEIVETNYNDYPGLERFAPYYERQSL